MRGAFFSFLIITIFTAQARAEVRPPLGHVVFCLGERAQCMAKHASVRAHAVSLPNGDQKSLPIYSPLFTILHFYDSYEHALTASEPVRQEDLLITGPGSELKFFIGDDTVLTLAPNSALKADGPGKFTLYRGHVGVVRIAENGKAIAIHTLADKTVLQGNQDVTVAVVTGAKLRLQRGQGMLAQAAPAPESYLKANELQITEPERAPATRGIASINESPAPAPQKEKATTPTQEEIDVTMRYQNVRAVPDQLQRQIQTQIQATQRNR